ncbi:hypothetical protein NP233_g12058 [Leucocoprinus birnbaumii]|uniref:F-box domain-containing protein n=1 Tax=Leucocoprinus birnbaumii TaxID=56174 RepID=A0AAD5YQB9_9AGAR|nr:hypothetical protein NP233_g12058 [Leucocoprinus birnbaumii]
MKAMMLDLFIDCFRGRFILSDGDDSLTQEDAFNAIFVENADKLRVLGMRMWPEEWLPHLEKVQATTSFSHLEEIWIKSPGAGFEEKFSITNAPRLRKVELVGAAESAVIVLPWPQITHLTLSDIPSDLCLKLLIQCTNLEHFTCDDLMPSASGSSIANDRVTFPNLKIFHYLDRELSSEWREAMGRYLQFPVLESVIWRPDWSAGVERQMLRQHPESIQTLEFRFRRRDQSRLKPMFIALNSLEELKISCWPSIKLSVLELLTPQKKRPLLPSLQKLHLTARSNEMTPNIISSLLTMVNMRRTLTHTKLEHLVLSYYVRSFKLEPWPTMLIEGFKALVRDGMKIVIEADGEEVYYDWLYAEDIVECSISCTSTSDISDTEPRVEA